MNLFKRKPLPPPPRIEIVQRDALRLTIEEARRDPAFVTVAFAALHSQPLQAMLDVMWASHLGRKSIIGTPEERVAHADRCAGYAMALNDLESLGQLLKEPEPLAEDFAPENADRM